MMATNEAATEKASTAQLSAFETLRSVKVRDLTKEIESLVDFRARKPLQALGAETLAGIGAHHAAVKHGVPPGGGRELRLRGEKTEKAAGKAVARAGWINHLLKRKGRCFECA